MGRTKLKNRNGFTMLEMLCVVLILVLLSAAITLGMTICDRSFVETKTRSESSMLTASINSLIADELRYAADIEAPEGILLSYTSTTRGLGNRNLAVNGKGRIVLCSRDKVTHDAAGCAWNPDNSGMKLLGEGSYILNCKAENLKISFADGIFTVSYDIHYNRRSGSTIESESFQVKPLQN